MKAISPLISIVLILAVTISVASLIFVFIGGLTTTYITDTESDADKQLSCGKSVLDIKEVYSSFSPRDSFNVTVSYVFGDQNLYNFNLTFIDNTMTSVLVQPTIGKNLNKSYPLTPGSTYVFNLDIGSSNDVVVTANLPGSSLQKVVVSGMCQDTYPVPAECEAGRACMK